MDNEGRTFGLATVVTIAGLAVMLWGVTLNHGLAFNTPMLAGGAIVAVGIGIITVAIMRIEAAHEGT